MSTETFAGIAYHAGDIILSFRTADGALRIPTYEGITPRGINERHRELFAPGATPGPQLQASTSDWQPGNRIRTLRHINLRHRQEWRPTWAATK